MTANLRPRKSKHDDLIKTLFGYGSGIVPLLLFAFVANAQRGVVGLLEYGLTATAAFTVGFLSIVFVPWGSRWVQLGLWLLPVTIPIVISMKGYVVGWLFGHLLGILTASRVASGRRKRAVAVQFGGRVLLTAPKKRKTLTAALTITGFREALSQLDDSLQPVMTLSINGKRLDVFGPAAGPLVVYGTLDESDDLAWRRLSTPDISDPDLEVTVPVGTLNGVYRKQSTVDMKLAKQAGEYFIRTGQLDPTLTWESGDDVHNRLPPTRLRT